MRKILIVDDVAAVRAYVRLSLRNDDTAFVEASGGRQALDVIGMDEIDIVVCDLNMPAMNGMEFVRELRSRGDNTPVLMLTAESDGNVVSEMIKLGIQGYVIKPFKPAVLASRVAELLAARA
jgi:DNA-binding response OmpR family regulator